MILHFLTASVVSIGDPGAIRTPDPRLRRPLLYPAELLAHDWFQEPKQVMRIELTFSAWKADVLPLNHTCNILFFETIDIIAETSWCVNNIFHFFCELMSHFFCELFAGLSVNSNCIIIFQMILAQMSFFKNFLSKYDLVSAMILTIVKLIIRPFYKLLKR